MSSLNYFILPKDLQSKLHSSSKMEYSTALVEALINEKSQHHPTYLLKYSKFTHENTLINVQKGQYFTSHAKLANMLNMSVKQIRNRLHKLVEKGLVKIDRVKDADGFDLGLKMTYNPIFKMFNEGNRHVQGKSKKNSQELNKRATNNKKVLPKGKQTVVDPIIEKRLQALKCSRKVMGTLLSKYSKEEIGEYLDLLKVSKGVTNPVAWIQAALKQKYDLTKLHREKNAKDKEAKQKEAEKIRTKIELQERELKQKKAEETVKKIQYWLTINSHELPTLVEKTVKTLKDESFIIFKSLLKKKNELGLDWIEFMSKNSMFKSLVYSEIMHIIEVRPPTLTYA